ncbi:hypothetical protein NEUTE1DRAFT_147570 [Neurospora tetrasperma FGSC 2508]|uniref:Uncharacterized protein n=1 Tax=Neurospora tetrasperma (strain FGSC 2508 / ATCC MYA-4615 / P0657) TaxID=510951 RepID=F8MPH1_NEUT8|nr:uncharacterized protein NEUTE1DRAFT_147570 [Neurospora tetrasperma FGSC 2508]EGO57130.1 hypothetical protein NEUTE1DRAFT_147570 [Neurospora tetrasperma FGSC 2508]EGZ69951.1 hypothetical protein NEUTE2DRAFT_90987 [Neurospora tetrasperma FGSC 2509]
MPETSLPSYQEATRTLDWLELVGPSISIRDYARLCRVSRHFCDYFLPRLWTDPFAMCYALDEPTDRLDGRIPRTELFTQTVPNARLSTRSLVFAFTPRIRDWPSVLDRYVLSSWLPNVRCMTLIDCPPPSDHERTIQFTASQFPTQPYVVAAARCSKLRVQLHDPEQFREVVYLDDSRVYDQYGRALPIFKSMHNLRILRATGHNMGDSHATQILDKLWQWLWSLDLSNNRLSDRCLQAVARHGFWGSRRLGRRQDDGSCSCAGRGHRHELEGSVCSSKMGLFIHETPWTEDLRLYHARRYHEDSPEYVFRANPFDTIPEYEKVRKRAFDDSLDAVIKAICLEKDISSIRRLEICQRPLWGVTHLYLNQNPMITAKGFKLLMELGLEQLQRFECDSMLCMTEADMSQFNEYYHDSRAVPSSVSGCKTQALAGILGLSHLFRPVFSNLQILRIHHSLVTNLPSLVGFDDLSALEKIWFAETFLLPRADLVFPNPFHPDMNPWLSSLTLTHIPRYSTGPLIERLKGLLKAAWFQEQTIAKLRAEYRRVQSRHPPPLLTGLRKIFLEFDVDLREKQGKDHTGTAGLEGFDAEALLNSGATEEFNTFGGFTCSSNSNGTSGPSTSSAVRHVNANNNGTTRSWRQQPQHGSELDRLGTETPWVRAVLQSRHQKWPQEVERRAHENLDWNQPIYVTSISKAASGKTNVFVGYHHEGHNQPVLNNNDGASSSKLASPSVQNLYDPWQSPYLSQEQAREPQALSPLSERIQRRANSLLPQPPAYTAWPIPPSTPLPPPAETPDLLTPVPPCYTSFPFFLSPQEKQASISTYNLLISRVLWLHPNSVRDPGDRADPSAAGHAGPAGSPTAGLDASSSFNASSMFDAYEGPRGPGDIERDNELLRVFGPIMAATPSMVRAGVPTQSLPRAAGEGGEMRRERLYRPDHIVRRQMEQDVRQAAESRARAAAAAREGVGAGCYVFWSAWKAGLFGDVVFPSFPVSSSTSSVSRDGYGGLNGHGESQDTGDFSGGRMAGGDGVGGQDSEANTSNAAKPERENSASKRNLLRKDMRRPTQEELGQMKDVIEELKKFRRLTGGGGSSKSHCSKDKGKGKQKAMAVTADDRSPGGNYQEGDEQDEDSKWAGKHWMGELKVIRKQPEPEGGGF